jgi:NarL family two-component system response regulator LiaR
MQPDVVLCDVMLGDLPNGFELPERLRAAGVACPPIIYLSQFANSVLYQRAVASGAAGYVLKTVRPEALRAAVLTVAAGSTVFPRAALNPDLSGLRPPSPREADILQLVADGRSNGEIAAHLGIGESTVETHLERLRIRYGSANRTQLALLADREGWLSPAGRLPAKVNDKG